MNYFNIENFRRQLGGITHDLTDDAIKILTTLFLNLIEFEICRLCSLGLTYESIKKLINEKLSVQDVSRIHYECLQRLRIATKRLNEVSGYFEGVVFEEIILDIEYVPMSVRTANCLKNANIHDLHQLKNYRLEDIRRIKNIGVKTIEEIQQMLKEHGLSLRDENLPKHESIF